MRLQLKLPALTWALLSSINFSSYADSGTQALTLEEQHSYYDSWNTLKQHWLADYGLQLNMDYNMLGFTGTDSVGESSVAAGIARIHGRWDFIQSDSGSKGGLVFKFEHRHKYTDSTPKFFGMEDLGYVGFTNLFYGDQGYRTTHLFWRQTLYSERMVVYVGFLDMTDYVDFYALGNPWTDFHNMVFTTGSGTMGGNPDGALGVMVGGFMSDTIYGSASIIDAKGNAEDLAKGAKDLFDEGATWKSLEIGWTPSQEQLFTTNAHITLWHRDAIDNDKAGGGVNLSISGLVAEQWLPFLRAGWADEGGALYDRSVAFGFGYIPKARTDDMFGLALNWATPMKSSFGDIDDQYTAETYYRVKVLPWLQLSPSIQVMNHTVIAGDDDVIGKNRTNVIFGLEARFLF
jgi:porin